MKNTILISTSTFAEYDKALLNRFSECNLDYVCNPYKRKLTEGEISELIIEHQPIGIIAGVEPITRNVLTLAQNLKTISRLGIGMDSVDLAAAKEMGISITNTPDAPTQAVAELTLGLILSLLRKIHVADQCIRNGKWYRPNGFLLANKTIGIIGCGRIGKRLSSLIKVFTDNIIGYDPVKIESYNIVSENLNTLLEKADILCLHMPLTKETYHLINDDTIKKMKKNTFIVNTSRGGLVDENAVYNALLSGHLAGFAADCFEKEPYTGELSKLENTILTSHIGSYARECRITMERQALNNLLEQL